MSTIEALYIFDEHNHLLFNHVYTGRPQPPATVLPLYLQHASPRPSVIYLPSTSPSTVLFSIIQDNLLFISPSSSDVEPLLVLEFLHRVADALEEFVGSPLLATKLTANYDIAAQVVAEMADAGVVCQGEANALRDVVETGSGVLKNLLGGVGLPGLSGNTSALSRQALQPAQSSQGSAVPWRRSNVRHTNNELYVDIVESLSVILAPSGRPLSAFAHGNIAFTSKVSGVPDLLLSLSTGGKGAGMGTRGDQLRTVMDRVVFHPCVRLNRWKNEGVFSFVPPDGRFALCGYEVDLLGPDLDLSATTSSFHDLNLPATIEIKTCTGATGSEFEVRVTRSSMASSRSTAAASLQSNLNTASRPGAFRTGSGSDPKAPVMESLMVHVPIPPAVRNVNELRPTRGEAQWIPGEGHVEWRIPSRDLGPGGAVLRCSVQGPIADEEMDVGVMHGMTATTYDYDEDQPSAYQSESEAPPASTNGAEPQRNPEKYRELMPTSAMASFSVKGWLASGLKVESLLLDTKKSRGIGADVKPYKGVKYLTVSKRGMEIRC